MTSRALVDGQIAGRRGVMDETRSRASPVPRSLELKEIKIHSQLLSTHRDGMVEVKLQARMNLESLQAPRKPMVMMVI